MKKSVGKAETTTPDELVGRKQSIIRTAARLFAAHGYKATTMDSLADECGINKATLYHYFPSKAHLLLAISLSVRDELTPLSEVAAADPQALAGLIIFATGILEIANRDREAFTVYFQESAQFQQYLSPAQYNVFRDSERSMMKIVFGILNKGMYNGELVNCDVRYVGRLLVFMVLSVARWPEPQIDVGRVIATLEAVFLKGLLKAQVS